MYNVLLEYVVLLQFGVSGRTTSVLAVTGPWHSKLRCYKIISLYYLNKLSHDTKKKVSVIGIFYLVCICGKVLVLVLTCITGLGACVSSSTVQTVVTGSVFLYSAAVNPEL